MSEFHDVPQIQTPEQSLIRKKGISHRVKETISTFIEKQKEQIDFKKKQKELALKYKVLRKEAWGVNYAPRMGFNWSSSAEKSLITGYEDRYGDNKEIDCNVVVVQGDKALAMMHVSPQTMPDEWLTSRLCYPYRTDVDKNLQLMVEKTGVVKRIVIITGNELLGRQLQEVLIGGENVWGELHEKMVPPEIIQIIDLGTGAKEVVADRKTNCIMVADVTKGIYHEIT